jgi:hypothetical protein
MSRGNGLFRVRRSELTQQLKASRAGSANPNNSVLLVVGLGTGLPVRIRPMPPFSLPLFLKLCEKAVLGHVGRFHAVPGKDSEFYLACAWFSDSAKSDNPSGASRSVRAAADILNEYVAKHYKNKMTTPILLSIARNESQASHLLKGTGDNQGLVSQEIWSDLTLAEKSLALDANIHPPAFPAVNPSVDDLPDLDIFKIDDSGKKKRIRTPAAAMAPVT